MSRPRAKKRPGRRPKKTTGDGTPRATRLGILLLRLWTGGFFLATAQWKLFHPDHTLGEQIVYFRDTEYVGMVERAIEHPPQVLGHTLEVYAGFLEHVMLPARGIFAPGILLAELLLGIGLVLGLGVRFLAGAGVLLMLAFNLAKPGPRDLPDDPVGVPLFTVGSANWPVTLILLLLALAAAGRVWGLDAWVRRQAPRWLRWIS